VLKSAEQGYGRGRQHSADVKVSTTIELGFGLEFFHDTLDQLFGVGEIFHDELDIHNWFARPALALAIDAVLADESHRVGYQIHGDGETSSGNTHPEFEVFEFFLLFVEHGHQEIVNGDAGIIRFQQLALSC
jgi:hypothetical protein